MPPTSKKTPQPASSSTRTSKPSQPLQHPIQEENQDLDEDLDEDIDFDDFGEDGFEGDFEGELDGEGEDGNAFSKYLPCFLKSLTGYGEGECSEGDSESNRALLQQLLQMSSGEGEIDIDSPFFQDLMAGIQRARGDMNDDDDDDESEEEEVQDLKTTAKKHAVKKSASVDDIDGIDDNIDGVDDSPGPALKKSAKKGGFQLIDPFSTKHDYYEIFNISQSAEKDEIIKSYKRLALEYHPDRNMGDKTIEKKFAKISQIHQTLIDPRKRKFYDTHGELQNTDMSEGFLSAYDLFKQTCPTITPNDTELYKAKYLDTEEEYTDVVNAFEKCKGDLFMMMRDELFFSSPETWQRDHDMVEMLIKRGDIKDKLHIATFRLTSPTASDKLAQFQKEEEEKYDKLYEQAVKRATKKARHGPPSQKAIDNELHALVLQQNSAGNGGDTMENIALSLSTLAGSSGLGLDTIDAKAAELEAKTKQFNIPTAPAPKKGGRTSNKQNKNTVLTDLSRDLAKQEKDQQDAEKATAAATLNALSKESNPKKRSRRDFNSR